MGTIRTNYLMWSKLHMSTLTTRKFLLWHIVSLFVLLNQCKQNASWTSIYSSFVKYQIYSCTHGKLHQSRWVCFFQWIKVETSGTQAHLLWSWVLHLNKNNSIGWNNFIWYLKRFAVMKKKCNLDWQPIKLSSVPWIDSCCNIHLVCLMHVATSLVWTQRDGHQKLRSSNIEDACKCHQPTIYRKHGLHAFGNWLILNIIVKALGYTLSQQLLSISLFHAELMGHNCFSF